MDGASAAEVQVGYVSLEVCGAGCAMQLGCGQAESRGKPSVRPLRRSACRACAMWPRCGPRCRSPASSRATVCATQPGAAVGVQLVRQCGRWSGV